MIDKPIYVTQPSLASIEEYIELLKSIWKSGILTHNGPLVQRFEKELAEKIGLRNFVSVTNGTIAIQMAIKSLELKGEIITTPFSWVATVSAIKWEGCTPVFCDIDEDSLNMDPTKIEALITERTVGILPVHVFGNPCDVEAIEKIAKRYNLKVIYDGAHAIGSRYKDRSLLEYGDVSTTSLHATKLLNTGEGGGCITTNSDLCEKLKRIRFFGHNESKDVVLDGINGKMTEIHAALGIANLRHYEEVLEDRRKKYSRYYSQLSKMKSLRFQKVEYGETNYSYFPVIFETEKKLLEIQNQLNEHQIFPRRYFFPSLNTYKNIVDFESCPISEDISKRILCLPLYWDLEVKKIDFISSLIINGLES